MMTGALVKLGFITDIHEDIIRLKEALQILEKMKCDEIICLGDLVGFTLPFYKYINNRNAEECVNTIRKTCKIIVSGNHDLYAVRKIPEFKSGFEYPEKWYELDYNIREKTARKKIWLYEDGELPINISDSSKEFLKNLPEYRVEEFDGEKFLFSHFQYPDLTGSSLFFPTKHSHLQEHFEFMSKYECSYSFSGHGHPEGATIVNSELHHFKFGTYEAESLPMWIVCPCAANTSRANGILTFDIKNKILDIIPLLSSKIVS